MTRIGVGVFLVAFITLMSELVLVRAFDVLLTPNIGYMVITCAMFSLGLGGIYLVLYPRRLSGNARNLASYCGVAYGLALIAILPLCNIIPFDYHNIGHNAAKQLLAFLALYLVLIAPFFFAGLIFSSIFSNYSKHIGRLYFWDLFGAGVGSVAFIPFLPSIGPGGVLIVAGGLAFLASAVFATSRIRIAVLLAAGAATIAVPLIHTPSIFDFDLHSDKRGVRLAQQEGRIEFTRWDPISRVDIVDDIALKGIDRLHVAYDGGNQTSHFFAFDGDFEALRTGIEDGSIEETHHFWWRGVAAAHYLKRDSAADVLVIGSAGGQETKAALTFGANSVDAVELVGTVIELGRGQYADYIGNIFQDPRVSVHHGEGRSFLRSTDKRYDIVQIFSNHTSSSIASGTGAMQTTYLQTAEAYMEYFNHLTDDGVLQINHHIFPRMISTAALAWGRLGRSDFQRHVALFERQDAADRLPTMLIKMTPWQAHEIDSLKEFFSLSEFEHALIEDPIHPDQSFLASEFYSDPFPAHLVAGSKVRLYPSTDDRPFFNFLRAGLGWLEADPEIYLDPSTAAAVNSQLHGFIPSDVGHLFVTSISSLFFVALFILAPMRFSTAGRMMRQGRSSFIAYFSCLGFGFIVLELTLVQVFMKLIGSPLHTFSAILFAVLLFSGIGSLVSKRLGVVAGGRSWLPFIGVLIVGSALILSQDILIDSFLSASLPVRILVAVMAVAPLAFFLGMPFPLGIATLEGYPKGSIAWAWALNGLFTVVGGVASVLLAVFLGFRATMFIALFIYVVAFVQMLMLQRGAVARGAAVQAPSAAE